MERLPKGFRPCAEKGCSNATKDGRYCRDHRRPLTDFIGPTFDAHGPSIDAEPMEVRLVDGPYLVELAEAAAEYGPPPATAVLGGKPSPWSRLKARGYGQYLAWRDRAVGVMRADLGQHDGPVAVTIAVAGDLVLVTVADEEQSRPAGIRGDIDNYAKAVLDALQEAGTIADDRQVVRLAVRFYPDDEETT